MPQNIIGQCPVCHEALIATRLSCHHCGLELSNDFTLNRFSCLTEGSLVFIETFIKCSGNLKEVQKELHLSYSSARRILKEAQKELGLLKEQPVPVSEPAISALPIYEDESATVQTIKRKLNRAKGLAQLTTSRGKIFSIYYEEYGNGIYASNLPKSRMLTWTAFDRAVELLEAKGGAAPKGLAMKARLGEPELTTDTVEGYVAYHAFGVKKGESTIRTISALAAILEWAGICENGYGYLRLKK